MDMCQFTGANCPFTPKMQKLSAERKLGAIKIQGAAPAYKFPLHFKPSAASYEEACAALQKECEAGNANNEKAKAKAAKAAKLKVYNDCLDKKLAINKECSMKFPTVTEERSDSRGNMFAVQPPDWLAKCDAEKDCHRTEGSSDGHGRSTIWMCVSSMTC